ncbi:hypothetical protein HJFPF1_10006 [Paramyrothecium foliicola]|nr:hypothetical protein HJFPF1_10006 [Paramyrothecium foliicola]
MANQHSTTSAVETGSIEKVNNAPPPVTRFVCPRCKRASCVCPPEPWAHRFFNWAHSKHS